MESEWIANLLFDIPLRTKPIPPIIMHCDSTSVITIAHNTTYNGSLGKYV